MVILRAILSVVIGLLGCWAIIGNWWIVIRWYVFRKKGESLVPFVGGIFVALAMLSYPEPRVRHLAWIPLIVDLGCSLMFPAFLYSVFVLKCFKKKDDHVA
jgi:hypothetical protein